LRGKIDAYSRDIIYTKQVALTPRNTLRTATFSFALAVLSCGGPHVGSIGAVLSHDTHDGGLLVHEAPPGLSASSAGLLEGDQVKMVDGVLVDDLDSRRIRALLRGPVGSTVTLTVIRGDEVLQLEIERSELGHKAPVQDRYQKIE
jgi:C-terminal processing protease CtpA/Prc